MKKLLTAILALSMLPFLIYAQEDEPKDEMKKAEELIQTARTKTDGGSRDRVIVEASFDQAIHDIDGLDVQWYSRGFNFYFMYDVKLGKSLFSIAPGLGISTSNLFFNRRMVETIDTSGARNGIAFTPFGENEDVKKYKLGLTYLEVPLELRFRTRPNAKGKSFKIAAGFKAGLLIDGKTKEKAEINGDTKKFKQKNYSDLNRFRYGPTFRVGFGPFNIFGYYNLANLFESGKGPDFNTFSVGFSLNGL